MSVPGIEIEVERSFKIKLQWQDAVDGSAQEACFEEYEAVIVQHEIDHLEGTVLLDRVSGFKRRRYMKAKRRNEVIA